MASKKSSLVYRVTNLPGHVDRLGAAELLVGCIPGLRQEDVRICSLAPVINGGTVKTATVMFKSVIFDLDKGTDQDRWEFPVSGLLGPIVLDTNFYGLTPLNEVNDAKHESDCIVISGLGSHPIGSWQPRGEKSFMWIRDELPNLHPGVRFIIYGYDTKLVDSKSFQSLPDLARSFIAHLQVSKWVSRPLVFLAHSLGGVLVKQAIVALAGSGGDDQILSFMKGGIFFGVPSEGMAAEDIYSMLGEQPNKALLDCLSDRSNYVPKLERDFERLSSYQRMRLVWAYETQETPSLSDAGGRWGRSGPGVVMVPPSSATGGRLTSDLSCMSPITSNDELVLQIDADHSGMVKFNRGDQLITALADKLGQILRSEIQSEAGHHLDRSLTPTGASTSASSFRQRCKELLSALDLIEEVPGGVVETLDFSDGVSEFFSLSGEILKMIPRLNYLNQNNRSQVSGWVETVEDFRWLFNKICSSSTAQSARLVSILSNCTSSCSDIMDLLNNMSLTTKDFFKSAPSRLSLGNILLSTKNKDRGLSERFEKLAKYGHALILALELSLTDSTPDMFQKLKDPDGLTSHENKCIGALRTTNPSRDREAIVTSTGQIVKGTCRWILSTSQFQTWIEVSDPSKTLWLSAPPGMGKTYLSIFLSQRLQRLCEVQQNSIAIFFFCDNKVDTRNTGAGILRGLVYQLIQYRAKLIRFALQQWEIDEKVFSGKDSFDSVWVIFEDMIDSLPSTIVYCLIDALDECEKESVLLLLNRLNSLVKTKSRFKLIAVSRRHPNYLAEALLESIPMEIDQDSAGVEDIKCYISERVHHLARIKRFENQPLHRHIQQVFLEKAQDTFLWVSLMIHDLLQKTILQIETALEDLPTGLDALYSQILSQIEPEKANVISKLLGWVLFAERPLALSEISEALYIQPTSYLTAEQVCLDYVLNCGHLLQVTEVEAQIFWGIIGRVAEFDDDDANSSVDGHETCNRNRINPSWQYEQQVTLVHQSAKEYLLQNRGNSGTRLHIPDPQSMHEEIAGRLIHEMERGGIYWAKQRLQPSSSRYLAVPLVDYAIQRWHVHFNQVADYDKFARRHEEFFGEKSSIRCKWQEYWDPWEVARPMPLLHVAALLHLVAPARRLLEMKKEMLSADGFEIFINQEWGRRPRTAFGFAQRWPKLEMIELLLDFGADLPKSPYWTYSDPSPADLARLIEGKRGTELVKGWGGGFLAQAARRGDLGFCRLLIESHGVPVDSRNYFMETALMAAISSRHLELAHVFVNDWHASVSTEEHGRMLRCIGEGLEDSDDTCQKALVDLIKAWNININACTSDGRGLMSKPFWNSVSEMTTASLLGLGLDPSARDECDRTVLDYMTFGTALLNVGVARLLLKDGRLNINPRGFDGGTVLHSIAGSSMHHDEIDGISNKIQQRIKGCLDLGFDRYLENSWGESPLDILNQAVYNDWRDEDSMCLTSCDSEGADARFKALLGALEILREYQTVPLFVGCQQQAVLGKMDSQSGTDDRSQSLNLDIKKFGHMSVFRRRKPWLGKSRRRKAILLCSWKSLPILDHRSPRIHNSEKGY